MLKTLHSYKHTTSIFDDFNHYEKRQEEEDGKKQAIIPGMNMKNNESHRGGHDGPHSGGRGGGRHGDRDGHNRGNGGEYHDGQAHRGDREGGRRGKPRN